MNIDYQSKILDYHEVAAINSEHNTYLVQHSITGKIFVKKTISIYNKSVYEQLISSQIDGIPHIYEIEEYDGKLTVIEEYISGMTLSEILKEHGPLSEQLTRDYITQLCIIVSHLHSAKPAIIHRDIKPSNIIVTPSGKIVLIDLNAARSYSPKDEDTILLGTKGYAAPEQYGFGSSDEKTDIYAIGMLINELLLGRLSHEITKSITFSPIIEKCTKINPKERYQNVNEISSALSINRGADANKRKNPDYYPPGFRSGKASHMIIASIVYLAIIGLCSTITLENVSGVQLQFERCFLFLIFISVVCILTNYLNIQQIMPLCQKESFILRAIGKLALSTISAFILMFIMVFLELILFK